MTPKVIIAWRKEEQSENSIPPIANDWGACTRHGCSCRHFEGNGELCETCGHFEGHGSTWTAVLTAVSKPMTMAGSRGELLQEDDHWVAPAIAARLCPEPEPNNPFNGDLPQPPLFSHIATNSPSHPHHISTLQQNSLQHIKFYAFIMQKRV